MMENSFLSLGSHFEEFISKKISSGRYDSASEVIRTALRLLEDEDQKTENLKTALELGERSQMAENFNPKNHLKELRNKHV